MSYPGMFHATLKLANLLFFKLDPDPLCASWLVSPRSCAFLSVSVSVLYGDDVKLLGFLYGPSFLIVGVIVAVFLSACYQGSKWLIFRQD